MPSANRSDDAPPAIGCIGSSERITARFLLNSGCSGIYEHRERPQRSRPAGKHYGLQDGHMLLVRGFLRPWIGRTDFWVTLHAGWR